MSYILVSMVMASNIVILLSLSPPSLFGQGLEVSKAGRYQTLPSDKNFLEMSDSGVEFTSSGLPLDSDTDVPLTYASHKPLLDSVHSDGFVTAQPTIAEGTESNSRTPDSILSVSPASLPKANGQPDGDLMGVTTPDSPLKSPEMDGIVDPAPVGSPAKEPSKDAGPAEEAASTASGATENATTWDATLYSRKSTERKRGKKNIEMYLHSH